MDKLDSDQTIVIKINGKKQLYKEEPAIIDDEKGFVEQTQSPEAVSADSLVETAAAQDIPDDNFDWILPEPDGTDRNDNESEQPPSLSSSFNNGKRQIGSWKAIILSILFAVMIGTSFGIIMLKLISTGGIKQSALTVTSAIDGKKASSKAAGTLDHTLKSWTAYVVQGGVYASNASAQEIVNKDAGNGIPAALIEMNGKQYILIGVADTIDEAKTLSRYLQGKGADTTYAKPFTIPEKRLSHLNADERLLIKDAAELFPVLTTATVKAINSGSLPVETTAAISRLNAGIAGKNNIQIRELKVLKTEITAAVSAVQSYQQKNDANMLTAAQQHLITFLSIYYSLSEH